MKQTSVIAADRKPTGRAPSPASRTGFQPAAGASSPRLHRGQDTPPDRLEARPAAFRWLAGHPDWSTPGRSGNTFP